MTIGRVASDREFGPTDWGQSLHAAIVSEMLVRVCDPHAAMAKMFINLPMLDGRQARLMGRTGHDWQPGNLWYYTRQTLNLLLLSTGFERVWFRTERHRYSRVRLSERMHGSTGAMFWLKRVERLRQLLPRTLRRRPFRFPSGTAVVSAVAAPLRPECVVSLVVPVFDKCTTFQAIMDALLVKHLPGVRKEIIVVESNSTDGGRDLVRSYEGEKGVRIVLQPGPRGKGNAVREGLGHTTGDVMIQDADLKYDLGDCDGLLAPTRRGAAGCR